MKKQKKKSGCSFLGVGVGVGVGVGFDGGVDDGTSFYRLCLKFAENLLNCAYIFFDDDDDDDDGDDGGDGDEEEEDLLFIFSMKIGSWACLPCISLVL